MNKKCFFGQIPYKLWRIASCGSGAKAPPLAARPDDSNPNLGHCWVVFEGYSQILPRTKFFRHGFEQNCSAMATQKL